MINFKKLITFIVGENGSGKSTFLEGLASSVGFNSIGGNANHKYGSVEDNNIQDILKLSRNLKTHMEFFFRAESFF